jgi:sterol desaturase/sphingolipid hydroxylase (fatty acid hydroxylase superfamily)
MNDRPQDPGGRARQVAIVAAFVLAGVAIWLVAGGGPWRLSWGPVTRLASDLFYGPLRYRVVSMLLTPAFLGVIALTLALERLVPARPQQKLLSTSSLQDAAWFFYEGVLHALIVVTWVALLTWAYARLGGKILLPGLAGLSDGWRFVIGIVLVDFCMWLQHRVNHFIPWLWELHAVHHSQKEINFFTDFRYHVLEYVVRETFLAIPFVLLGVQVPDIVYFSIVRRWYTRFYHANIRTDLGPLRYVLVTPQSHRIHHSIEPRHQNKNFGSLLSVFDFVFGTQYRGWNEYPETGVDDHEFPHETTRELGTLLLMPVRQMVYPLRRIGRELARKKNRPPA